jgi:5-(carboxyamino)imidazole ribonucleotide synthase
MLNFVGELPEARPVLSQPGAHWHDYGKTARPGRKVGHATLSLPSAASLAAALEAVGAGLGRHDQIAPVLEALGGR